MRNSVAGAIIASALASAFCVFIPYFILNID